MNNMLTIKSSKSHVFFTIAFFALYSEFSSAASISVPVSDHKGIIDITPYVSLTSLYDDNLFRLNNSTTARNTLGTSQMSDFITRGEAGVRTDLTLSRQLFSLDLNVERSLYSHFNSLDNTVTGKDLSWNWKFGEKLDGILGYSDDESASSFSDVNPSQALTQSINIQTAKTKVAGINWHIHPDWTLFGNYEFANYNNDAINFTYNDRTEEVVETGIGYLNKRQTGVSLSVRNTEIDYDNPTASTLALYGDTTKRKEIISNLVWLPTRRINTSAKLAIVKLDFPNHSNQNSTNFSQRWNLDYKTTPNLTLGFSIFREVYQINSAFSTFVINKGISFSPSWSLSERLSLTLNSEYKKQNYLGGTAISTTISSREDDLSLLGLKADYQATQRLGAQLSYENTRRNSNISGVNYKDNILMGKLIYVY